VNPPVYLPTLASAGAGTAVRGREVKDFLAVGWSTPTIDDSAVTILWRTDLARC